MMNRSYRFFGVVALSLTIVFGVSVADDYPASFAKDFGTATKALDGIGKGPEAKASKSPFADTIDSFGKFLLNLPKDKKWREELLQAKAKTAENEETVGQLGQLLQKTLDNRTDQLSALKSNARQISNGAVKSLGNQLEITEASCQNGDAQKLSQAKSSGQRIAEQFNWIRDESLKMINGKNKELKEQSAAELDKFLKKLVENSEKDEAPAVQAAAAPQVDLASKNPFEKFNDPVRLAALDKDRKEAKEKAKQSNIALTKALVDTVKKLAAIDKNDEKLADARIKYADQVNKILQNESDIFVPGANAVVKNCEKNVDGAFKDIEVSKSWIGRLVSAAKAQADANQQKQKIADLKCNKISADVQATFDKVKPAVQRLSSGSGNGDTPAQMVNDAVAAFQAAVNVPVEAATLVQPVIAQCEEAAQVRKDLKERIAPVQAQVGGATPSETNDATPRTGASDSNSGSNNNAAAHTTPKSGKRR